MQLGFDVQIPDGLLAANALLAENSRQGFATGNRAPYQGLNRANCTAALGLSWRVASGTCSTHVMGRFMSPDYNESGSDPDPVPYADYTNPQSLNLYAYVTNNPLSLTDADGHGCFDDNATSSTNANGDLVVNGDCNWGAFLPTQAQVSQFIDPIKNAMQQITNVMNTPGGPGCMAGLAASGAGAGAAVGGGVGLAGLAGGGVGAVVTEPAGLVAGGVGGAASGVAAGMSICPGGAAFSANGGGGGGGLSPSAKSKLGNLASRAGEKVRDVIRSRGGSGANVQRVGPWADRTLGEAAEAAARGDASAETAVKVAKQAGRLGQQY